MTHPALGTHAQGNAVANNVRGGGWITIGTLPAGEYVLLVATAPGAGKAELKMRTFGPTRVGAVQDGASWFDRGFDRSETSYDVFVTGNRNPFAGAHVRAWGYSGADLPLQVAGRMYGFVGYHAGEARLVAPGGATFDSFVVDEPGGAWTASFPAEQWVGPLCAPAYGCDPDFGDTREDPAFAIAADVQV